jgi:hypothetical protein
MIKPLPTLPVSTQAKTVVSSKSTMNGTILSTLSSSVTVSNSYSNSESTVTSSFATSKSSSYVSPYQYFNSSLTFLSTATSLTSSGPSFSSTTNLIIRFTSTVNKSLSTTSLSTLSRTTVTKSTENLAKLSTLSTSTSASYSSIAYTTSFSMSITLTSTVSNLVTISTSVPLMEISTSPITQSMPVTASKPPTFQTMPSPSASVAFSSSYLISNSDFTRTTVSKLSSTTFGENSSKLTSTFHSSFVEQTSSKSTFKTTRKWRTTTNSMYTTFKSSAAFTSPVIHNYSVQFTSLTTFTTVNEVSLLLTSFYPPHTSKISSSFLASTTRVQRTSRSPRTTSATKVFTTTTSQSVAVFTSLPFQSSLVHSTSAFSSGTVIPSLPLQSSFVHPTSAFSSIPILIVMPSHISRFPTYSRPYRPDVVTFNPYLQSSSMATQKPLRTSKKQGLTTIIHPSGSIIL